MSIIDIVILVFFSIGTYSGFKRGLLLEIISLSAFLIAIILGIKFMGWGAVILSDYVEGYNTFLSFAMFVIIFITIILIMNLIGKSIKKMLDITLLGKIDNLAGAIFGIIKWALILSIFFWLYGSLGGGFSESTLNESYLYSPLSKFAPSLLNLLLDIFPFIQEFFENSKEFMQEQNFKV